MNRNVLKRLTQVLFTLIIQGIILFISAWSVKWQWAWIFLTLGVIILLINFFVIPVELMKERGKKKENVKKYVMLPIKSINFKLVFSLYF